VYIAYAEGIPVSAAWISFHDRSPFAGLWGGSTLVEYRGRGFYTALLAARVQEAQQRGVRFLTIDASPMSRPIVEKNGFQFLIFTQPFKWQVQP
jgi:GNAT superfamily N-acetyltransferase